MNIDITDKEKEELKARVLLNVETRLTVELLDQMRREVTRGMLSRVYHTAEAQLEKLIVGKVTDEVIEAEIQRALKDLKEDRWGERNNNKFKEALDNAILRVTEAHGQAVATELKSLIYEALKNGFYEKK